MLVRNRLVWSVVIASAGSLVMAAAARPAAADARRDRTAIARLDAAWRPISKLAAGAARTQQACADAEKLDTAAGGLPRKPPAGSVVDEAVWVTHADMLIRKVQELVAVCKTKDGKLRTFSGKVRTSDEIVDGVDDFARAALDAARPRELPAAMKKFQSALKDTRVTSQRLCADHDRFARPLAELTRPPARADAALWKAAHTRLAESVDELKTGCDARYDEPVFIGIYKALHERYYALALAVPPTDR